MYAIVVILILLIPSPPPSPVSLPWPLPLFLPLSLPLHLPRFSYIYFIIIWHLRRLCLRLRLCLLYATAYDPVPVLISALIPTSVSLYLCLYICFCFCHCFCLCLFQVTQPRKALSSHPKKEAWPQKAIRCSASYPDHTPPILYFSHTPTIPRPYPTHTLLILLSYYDHPGPSRAFLLPLTSLIR